MRRFALSIIIAATPLLSQCGSDSNESELLTSDQKVPTFVIMGGNTSCGRDSSGNDPSPYVTGVYQRADTLMKTLHDRAGVKSSYITSCYGDSSTVVYSSSVEPDKIQQTSRTEFTKVVLDSYDSPEKEIYLVGHSYGGWLAMKVAGDIDEQIKGLFTIDPISRVKCSFSRPSGCQSSPTDVTKNQREAIQQRTGNWSNFYQTRTWYLHASSIKEAHKNYKIDTPHREIDTKAEVWNEIYSVVSSHF